MAGLSENFSTQQYFSRYCYATLREFRLDPLLKCKLRTQETHKQDLIMLENTGQPYRGVKADSIFNSFSRFKLFDYGMPPCLAHDLFLGCFNYDIMLIFRQMINAKFVTEKYLNYHCNFILKKLNTRSKITLNIKKNSITSKAVDVWHIIQITPFIFLKTPELYSDDSYKLLLMMKRITDFVTAPLISMRQIGILRQIIHEYLDFRKMQFNHPLRPKHHYMCHYPQWILQFGPLLPFSTLTGERKHSYFKTALRHANNYKNILKLCTERHQYWQALLNSNEERLKSLIFEDVGCPFDGLEKEEKRFLMGQGFNDNFYSYYKSMKYLGTSMTSRLIKICNSLRKKWMVMCEPKIASIKEKGRQYISTGIENIVLELDGTIIEEDEVFEACVSEGYTFMLLSGAQIWMPANVLLNISNITTTQNDFIEGSDAENSFSIKETDNGLYSELFGSENITEASITNSPSISTDHKFATFDVDYKSIPQEIIDQLKDNSSSRRRNLSNTNYNRFVDHIIGQMRSINPKIPFKFIRQTAIKITTKFPTLLDVDDENLIIGDGSGSLAEKLKSTRHTLGDRKVLISMC
ncbi:uncharacterized protein LOC129759183 [Uranotaenia lowii]|uniref:uncharacterized protein LOC129759183 n=1 Tax=Uranotaenia lowii TaxID=190385 RepID=UPI002478CF7A|nr:uncharacterized protein LOC129759183 [Uranotaenia lowii]